MASLKPVSVDGLISEKSFAAILGFKTPVLFANCRRKGIPVPGIGVVSYVQFGSTIRYEIAEAKRIIRECRRKSGAKQPAAA